MDPAEIVFATLTLIVSVTVGYFANSIHQRTQAEIRVKVAEQRFGAYDALWHATEVATPSRAETGQGPLTAKERTELHRCLTAWYYDKGNGMLLAEGTRNIYLAAKANLICDVNRLKPSSLASIVRGSSEPDRVRGEASMRQLSLMRTSMRGDLAIYTNPYGQDLTEEDQDFLRACHAGLDREPWRHRASWRSRIVGRFRPGRPEPAEVGRVATEHDA